MILPAAMAALKSQLLRRAFRSMDRLAGGAACVACDGFSDGTGRRVRAAQLVVETDACFRALVSRAVEGIMEGKRRELIMQPVSPENITS